MGPSRTIAAAFPTRADAAAAHGRLVAELGLASADVGVADLAQYDPDEIRTCGILAVTIEEALSEAVRELLTRQGGTIVADNPVEATAASHGAPDPAGEVRFAPDAGR